MHTKERCSCFNEVYAESIQTVPIHFLQLSSLRPASFSNLQAWYRTLSPQGVTGYPSLKKEKNR